MKFRDLSRSHGIVGFPVLTGRQNDQRAIAQAASRPRCSVDLGIAAALVGQNRPTVVGCASPSSLRFRAFQSLISQCSLGAALFRVELWRHIDKGIVQDESASR